MTIRTITEIFASIFAGYLLYNFFFKLFYLWQYSPNTEGTRQFYRENIVPYINHDFRLWTNKYKQDTFIFLRDLIFLENYIMYGL
jgi:hypothetical protein